MRRTVAMALLLLMLASVLSGCRKLVQDEDGPISVYATFYPIYALTDAVMHGVPDAALHCLVQPQDDCLRAYQLSDWDLALLSRGADAVIAGGRGLESFESTLFGWGEDGPAIAAVLYNLELYNQDQVVDGEAHSHLQGPNPHLYMSLLGAKQIVESISSTMVSLDPVYSEKYIDNSRVAIGTLVYMAQDYSFEVVEWIERETGANFGDNELAIWLERLDKARPDIILIERQSPQALRESLEDAGYAVAVIDVLSTHAEGEGFDRYLEIQGENAQALLDAFNRADAGKEMH